MTPGLPKGKQQISLPNRFPGENFRPETRGFPRSASVAAADQGNRPHLATRSAVDLLVAACRFDAPILRGSEPQL